MTSATATPEPVAAPNIDDERAAAIFATAQEVVDLGLEFDAIPEDDTENTNDVLERFYQAAYSLVTTLATFPVPAAAMSLVAPVETIAKHLVNAWQHWNTERSRVRQSVRPNDYVPPPNYDRLTGSVAGIRHVLESRRERQQRGFIPTESLKELKALGPGMRAEQAARMTGYTIAQVMAEWANPGTIPAGEICPRDKERMKEFAQATPLDDAVSDGVSLSICANRLRALVRGEL